jgi:2-(1,2-epoxy-1,2-dihydrophenyl)acetyl-CoA isomerase
MSLIETSQSANIFTITLNRPEKYNSFTEPMGLDLQKALKEAKHLDIRCVILKANGIAFCAGQDLPEVVERAKNDDYKLAETVRTTYNPVIKAIRNLEKPVVCAVQGTAAGAGANMAFSCDIVIASHDAKFIQAFSKIGLIPDSGGTFILPRIIGYARTNTMYLLDEPITAEEAVSMGLIYKSVSHNKLEEVTMNLSKKLASMPTKGFGLYKKAINRSFENTLNEQLELEADYQTLAGNTQDFREGVAAFLEKRRPDFKGK